MLDASRVRDLMEKAGLTRHAVATKAGIGQRTVDKVLNGDHVSEHTVTAIVRALGCSRKDIEKPGDVRMRTTEEMRKELRRGSYGRAHCCAYLIGDVSVLTTKRAFVVPVDAYVHVGVRASETMKVELFVPDGERWVDSRLGGRIAEGLRRHLMDAPFRERFPWCPPAMHITVVSEIPTGFGLHEECALALALAEAVQKMQGVEDDRDGLKTLFFAGALLSVRYVDISWATLVASQQAATGFRVLAFDRRLDGDIDLLSLYRRRPKGEDLARNVYPTEPFWKTTADDQFELNTLSFWWSEKKLRDNRDAHPLAVERLRDPMQYVFDEADSALTNHRRDFYRRFGTLMRLHQLLLVSVEATRTEVEQLLMRVDGIKGVLGAKIACAREAGAFVVLTDYGGDKRELERPMKEIGLAPLETFRRRFHLDG